MAGSQRARPGRERGSSTLLDFLVTPGLFWAFGRKEAERLVAKAASAVELATDPGSSERPSPNPTTVAACMLASCGEDPAVTSGSGSADTGHAHHGAHGGALIEIGGGIAHVEFVHDAKAGTVTLHVTGKDTKTPLKLTYAPDLNLVTAKGPKVLNTKPVGGAADGASQFQVTDALLKTDPLKGRIAIKVEGKAYHPEIEAHEHK
ncbi:MAG: hypothetical protein ACYTF5_22360 [Planctomycetota bacterium]